MRALLSSAAGRKKRFFLPSELGLETCYEHFCVKLCLSKVISMIRASVQWEAVLGELHSFLVALLML